MAQIEIVERRGDEYRVRVESFDGSADVMLALGDVVDASEGRLTGDETTASATIAYLLEHQDAADLPSMIDIAEVLAAYPDAVDRIVSLRA